ncbi:sulfurtransferase [Microvirga pudoricolor]|uniref:sulfurtransferase n=1 Tax=Microvirga pudoricolor TaxID=2778729 RepID=UPI00194FB359|nr:sulfurtransferase [Microvirga pudoricolor]MBM6592984.1 sulfurtransferase [Microvirga pudoricolor]
MTEPLIQAESLRARLSDPMTFVLDLRTPSAFEAGHVPGAVNSGYESEGWRIQAAGGQGMLPGPEHLSALFGRLGMRPEHHVVLVTAGEGASDLAAAARVYWTLKIARHRGVSVLDGGFRAWSEDASRPVETGPSEPRPAIRYPVGYDESLRSDLEATMRALEQGVVFVDARARAHYEGRDRAGSVKAAGHIPGALSYDYAHNVDRTTARLLSIEKLAERFAALGDGPVISYCNTGHTAALNWFVLSEVLGRPHVRLFDGSMSQWTQDPKRPVETGPAGPNALT